MAETPFPAAALVPLCGLGEALARLQTEAPELAVQGSLARGGVVLLRAFRLAGGVPQSPEEGDAEALLRAAKGAGGGDYLVGLRGVEADPERDEAVRRLRSEVDPKGILRPVG